MADLRSLPKVDALAASPTLSGFSAAIRTEAARAAIAALRSMATAGNGFDSSNAEGLALVEAERLARPSIRRVLNATGIVLHTGLGRARLGETVAKRLYEIADAHAAVELDLDTGGRGDRQSHVREFLVRLSGAESAFVVNNGAAAIFLALAAHCRGREVILSRGEMVEIGGSFRMPEVIAESGCQLVEVGCTNKTRLSDYEAAIGEQTAAILRCHPSNYRIVGFTQTPSDRELAALAKECGILFLHDLGNGCFWDTSQFGLPKETTVQEAIAAGADIVTASGDKLLGGPQVGMVFGSRLSLSPVVAHPLARALRVDKLALGALEACLRLHIEGRLDELPTYRYLNRPLSEIRRDAQRLARAYAGDAVVELGESEVGGGSVPGIGIPTWRVGISGPEIEKLAYRLRSGDPAMLGRLEDGRLWLDPRTLEPAEVRQAAKLLANLGAGGA